MATKLWECIERNVMGAAGPFQHKVSAADMSRATELSEALLSKWRNTPTMPDAEHLAALSEGLGIPYRELLDAALEDKGWLPQPPAGARERVKEERLVREAARGKAAKPLKNQSPHY